MARNSGRLEWLSLIDVSGPFLAGTVLEDTFPQGLEKVETPRRQRLRAAYEEWREAVDVADPQLAELHDAWVRMVLQELLEYEDEVLIEGEFLNGTVSYRAPEHGTELTPDFAVPAGDGNYRLLVSIYPPDTDLGAPLPSEHWPASPSERMTLLCRASDVRIGLISNGEHWMLINAPIGSTSGYATWLARLWSQEPSTLKSFKSLLGVRRAFGPSEDALDQLLERSLDFQEEVTDTLGEQVRRAVEVLIQALGRADEDRNGELLRDVEPRELYEAGLTVMMRLVFILCAEERGLLLLGDSYYDAHYAISTLRGQLREEADLHGVEVLERRYDAWSRILSTFRGIFAGIQHEAMRLPPLGGSLFDPDTFTFLEGRPRGSSWRQETATPLPIDNRTVLLLLTALQVLQQRGGAQILSYRALGVEQIGHVYEGLLEYTVARLLQTTVGLVGSQNVPSPTISLEDLEALEAQGAQQVAERLVDITGRSEQAVLNALRRGGDSGELVHLIQASGGDEPLARRLLPFVELIRVDSWGTHLVYDAGSFAVVSGSARRETGTHYTPRRLTETIVDKTLEPIVFHGPTDGKPRETWTRKSAQELLDLKVCDTAMGSGAFLVQACVYLSSHLVEAWAGAEEAGKRVTADGNVVDGQLDVEPLPEDVNERLLLARRLVSERCLYGVDLNPLAVELAKLSIWLVTMAKGRPFAFLDHNLRAGDSILGISQLDQLTKLDLHPKPGPRQRRAFGERIGVLVEEVVEIRMRLRAIPIRDIHDVEAMTRLDIESRDVIRLPTLLADAFVGGTLASRGDKSELKRAAQSVALAADGCVKGIKEDIDAVERLAYESLTQESLRPGLTRRPFHWPLEFPEVFARDQPGFDGIVGNPPFLGNRLWKSCVGESLQWQVKMLLGAPPGKVDLCVAFHRRAVDLLRDGACYGMLATTNIAEGSAIKVGLGHIVTLGDVFFSRKSVRWPGKASVVAAIVCFHKGSYAPAKDADGHLCSRIGPRLEPETAGEWTPQRLEHTVYSFAGVDNSKGLAFVISSDDPWYERLASEPDSLLAPYVTGNDITSHALRNVKRWALDILDMDLEDIRRHFPVAFEFLDAVVRPTRSEAALKSYKGLYDRWWQFWNHRAGQVRCLREEPRFIAFSKVTKHPVCITADPNWIYTNKVLLIKFDRKDLYAICLSAFFTEWQVAKQGARFGVGDSFSLSIREGIETFPLPNETVSESGIASAELFEQVALRWCERQRKGITDFANSLGDPECDDTDIREARAVTVAIDNAVAAAFGWENGEIERGFHPASYIGGDDNVAWVVPEGTRAGIVAFVSDLNRAQVEREKGPGSVCAK